MSNIVANRTISGPVRMNTAQRLHAMLLGGCMIHWPIVRTDLHRTKLACDMYGRLSETHTFGEMFQLLDVLQHRLEIPDTLKRFARVPANVNRETPVTDFSATDIVLVSPSSPIELTFRGVAINRHSLLHRIHAELPKDDPMAPKLLQQWLRKGLERVSESARSEAAAKLLPLLNADTASADLARAAIRETRSHESDIHGDLRRLRDLLGRPIGLVLYYFHYMPDGRALSWPADFHRKLIEASSDLEIPVHDPAPLVHQHGVATALKGNRHYRRSFLPVAGAAIADFAFSVFKGSASNTFKS